MLDVAATMRLRPFWTSCGRVVLAKKKRKSPFAIFRVPYGRLVLELVKIWTSPPPRAGRRPVWPQLVHFARVVQFGRFCNFPGSLRPFSTRIGQNLNKFAATSRPPFSLAAASPISPRRTASGPPSSLRLKERKKRWGQKKERKTNKL